MNVLDRLTEELIDLAVEEDMPSGDVTAQLTIDASALGTAKIIAREPLVLCGTQLIAQIVSSVSAKISGTQLSALSSVNAESQVESASACSELPKIALQLLKGDGTRVSAGECVAELGGALRVLIAAERTILNFLQHLSGIATYTREVTQRVSGMTILDTRKTTPGWRTLEKLATRTGGAHNHRMNLSDMILVKNNHIDANGGDIHRTLQRVFQERALDIKVEVEVRDQSELRAALEYPVDIIMLDNFSDGDIVQALQIVAARKECPSIEVSGGVTAERLEILQALGVRIVSMSALVGRARSVDLAMRIVGVGRIVAGGSLAV